LLDVLGLILNLPPGFLKIPDEWKSPDELCEPTDRRKLAAE